MSFSDFEYAGKRKQTRRERFLAEMEQVVPWSGLVALIEPHYPKAGGGAGGAFGGVGGRWLIGAGRCESLPLGRRGCGDIPLSSYISYLSLLDGLGGEGGGVAGRTFTGAGGLTFIPSLPTRTTTCFLLWSLLLLIWYLLSFKELNHQNVGI